MSGGISIPHYNILNLIPIPTEGKSWDTYIPKIHYFRFVGNQRHYKISNEFPIPEKGEDGDSYVPYNKLSVKSRKRANKRRRKHSKNLTDSFIRKILGSECSLKGSEFPDKIVEYRRLDLQLKRKIAQLKGVKVNQWH